MMDPLKKSVSREKWLLQIVSLSRGMSRLAYGKDPESGEVPTKGLANETKSAFAGLQTV